MASNFFDPKDPRYPKDFKNLPAGPPSAAIPDPEEEETRGLLDLIMQVISQAGETAGQVVAGSPIPEGATPSDIDFLNARRENIDSPQGFLENLMNIGQTGSKIRVGGFKEREAAKEAASIQASRKSRDVRRTDATSIEQEKNSIMRLKTQNDFDVAKRHNLNEQNTLAELIANSDDVNQIANWRLQLDISRTMGEFINQQEQNAIAERGADVAERKVKVQEDMAPGKILVDEETAGKLRAEAAAIPPESTRQDRLLDINQQEADLADRAQNATELGAETEALTAYTELVQLMIANGMDAEQAIASVIGKIEGLGLAASRSPGLLGKFTDAVKRLFGVQKETKPNPPSTLGDIKVSDTGGTLTLSEEDAKAILEEAGGDKEKARAIARERGLTF
jgi:hypothetical protein